MSKRSIHERPTALICAAALMCFALAACNSNREQAADTAMAAMAAPASDAAAAAKPSDAAIADIALTANSIDSTAGELAKTKAQSSAVKDFAQTMVTDHSAVNQQVVALATKLGVSPEDNDVSQQLKTGAEESQTNLQGKSGADFDKAYMDHEVSYHQAVIDALDSTLIPDAQNADLKALLVKVRPAFVAHLERAKTIQASLGA